MGRIIDMKCIFYGEMSPFFSSESPFYRSHGMAIEKTVQNEEGMFLCNNVDCAMLTTRLAFKNFIFLENNGIWLL
jgi:hypothetical protein